MSNLKHPNPRESGESPAKKKLSLSQNRFEVLGDTMHADESVPGSSGAVVESTPPPWFTEFEKRQQARLDRIVELFRQEQAALKFDMDSLKQEVAEVTKKLALAETKIDDLENRSRRNNLVIYNVPEGQEGSTSADCSKFVMNLLKACSVSATIQRAHRTGPPQDDVGSTTSGKRPRPRPIHVGFSSYVEKERSKKALVQSFKKQTENRFFVSDDFSRRVQLLRKEKLPELKQLRDQGKNAFFVFPAKIVVRDSKPKK